MQIAHRSRAVRAAVEEPRGADPYPLPEGHLEPKDFKEALALSVVARTPPWFVGVDRARLKEASARTRAGGA